MGVKQDWPWGMLGGVTVMSGAGYLYGRKLHIASASSIPFYQGCCMELQWGCRLAHGTYTKVVIPRGRTLGPLCLILRAVVQK